MHDTLRITRGHSRGAGDGEDVAHPPVPHALLHVRGPKAPDAANMPRHPGKSQPQTSTAPNWAAAPRSIMVARVADGAAATPDAEWQRPSRN